MIESCPSSIIAGEVGEHLDHRLSLFIQEVIRSHDLPGLAVGVVAGGEIAYARGFGVRRLGDPDLISAATIFHLASISKPFSATAIMQLVEQGRVQLDAPVVTYLPYFKLDDDRYRHITVRQMLSHISGMPDVQDYEWGNPQYDDGALERYVRSLSPQKLIADPGAKFAYSNMAFECLGDLIAKVSGMPFDDYVKSYILDPAGMAGSSFLKPDSLPANWAAPHVRILTNEAWTGYPYNRMHGPSSTLHSNAVEMCNWAIANLNRGSLGAGKILSPDSYDLLWQPQAQAGEGRHVGLSWFLAEYRGEKVVQHGGGDIGFETYLMILPDRRAAVVVLGNMLPSPVVNIAHAALDLLLGHEPDPIIPSAGLVVGKTLAEQGLDAAVTRWNALQADHPDAYDFGLLLDNLWIAVYMDRVAEAESVARLCTRLFPEPELKAIDKEFDGYQDLVAAAAVLRVIREH